MKTTIYFKHWKTGEQLVETGIMRKQLNNPSSDKHVLETEDGRYIDIIKSSVIKIELGENSDKLKVGCRNCK